MKVNTYQNLVLEDAVVNTSPDGTTFLIISNMTGLTQRAPEGIVIGQVPVAEVLSPDDNTPPASVWRLSSSQDNEHRERLLDTLPLQDIPNSDAEQLRIFLANNHSVFSLDEGERGETSLVTIDTDTGDASPRKQPPQRMPFVVREVARQLKCMQQDSVIRPCNSPWSSQDGSHGFCMDYRTLNSITKADTFPLPRIDDLLDQLGGACYFFTLDLASGFWQIRMESDSRKKTAFVTPHGLYEFLLMPFGLTNAPAVFQRLMQKVLDGLNSDTGSSLLQPTLTTFWSSQRHLTHLRKVIDRLKSANLKLKPSVCRFMKKEVGHIIRAEGLKPNPRITDAVQNFPTPENVQGVRRLLAWPPIIVDLMPVLPRLHNHSIA